MTTRLAMAVALLLVLLAQVWGLVSVLREDPLRNLTVKGKKAAPAPMVPGLQSLQPTPPAAPPDLKQGYLFNAERNLVAGGGKDGQSQNAGNVGIDKVQYSGSIIAGYNTKALLCYSLGGQTAAPPGGGASVTQKQGFLRVAVGDTVNGYKVTEILPERITFSRDGQKITKLLYDKTKERVQTQAVREPSAPMPAVSPNLQPSRRDETRIPTPVPQKQIPTMPSDEELRKNPLRKRPVPPQDSQAPSAQNVFQMLIEKQQQRNQALGRGEKNDAQ